MTATSLTADMAMFLGQPETRIDAGIRELGSRFDHRSESTIQYSQIHSAFDTFSDKHLFFRVSPLFFALHFAVLGGLNRSSRWFRTAGVASSGRYASYRALSLKAARIAVLIVCRA